MSEFFFFFAGCLEKEFVLNNDKKGKFPFFGRVLGALGIANSVDRGSPGGVKSLGAS